MSIIELFHQPLELSAPDRLVTPDDVGGSAAWQILTQNGALNRLWGEAALPATTTETPLARAEAIGIVLDDVQADSKPLVVASRAAAWIWLGGQAPTVADVIYSNGRYRDDIPGFKVRLSPFKPGQVERLGRVWVTNPTRTIRDLATWAEPEVALPLISALIGQGADLADAQAQIEIPVRLTNRPAARKTLELAAARQAELALAV